MWSISPGFAILLAQSPPSRQARICVTGQISDYQGKPEIVLTEPGQLIQ